MPVQVSYPGVYIEEIPSGVRTIVGVATSITAFLGQALMGPTDRAVTIFGYSDFARQFGDLDVKYPMGYAVRDFFVNGGAQAVIVRLYRSPAATAIDGAAAAQAIAAAAKGTANEHAAAEAATKAKAEADEAEHAWGHMDVPKDLSDAKNKAADEAKTAKDEADQAAKAALAATGTPDYPGKKQVADTKAQLQAQKADAARAAALAAAPVSWSGFAQLTAGTAEHGLALRASSPGVWANTLQARVDDAVSPDVAASFGLQPGDLFNIKFRLGSTGPVLETFLNVTVKESPRRIDRVLADESALVRVTDPANLPTTPPAANTPDQPWTDDADNVMGDPGKDLTPSDYEGDQTAHTGKYLLDDADLINLVCALGNSRGEAVPNSIYSDLLDYCVERRAFLLVDAPTTWTHTLLVSGPTAQVTGLGLTGERARNAAVFYPRIRESDPKLDGKIDTFPACGAIAGVMARTDGERGVWKASAGIDASLDGTAGLADSLTDRENGVLNQVGINALRSFPVYGRVVWGSRTLRGADQAADEYKYIPVRRTALFLEESLYRALYWVVFEPNDEPLWAQIRLNVGAFLQDLFRQGAFQGKTPAEAYFVKCDKETNPQNEINKGIVHIVVGFAPLKPAEFVIVQLQQIAGQIAT